MLTRCAYYFKLFTIVVLSVLFLSSVESAPDHPILFASILIVSLSFNRLLWHSAQKTEVMMKTNTAKTQQCTAPKNGTVHVKKKAA